MGLNRASPLQLLNNKLGLDTEDINDDTPLFSSGLLDSFSMVELIMFIEREGGIRLDPSEATLDNLDSVRSILDFAAKSHET
jgi:acyl carrier protein